MRIDRVTVSNFRNIAALDLKLSPGSVVVGENRVGKTNLLEAMRLVLDTSLSQNDRTLQKDDFWDGLSDGSDDWDPMSAGMVIEVSVEIVEFQEIRAAVTALGHALTVADPMRARLTYRFGPVDENAAQKVYKARIYGGDAPGTPISSELRSYVHFAFLHALRDVEDDIRNWRRSPLRKLLEAASNKVPEESLKVAREAIRGANKTLTDLEPIKDLGGSISAKTAELVGDNQSLATKLAIASPEPLRLLRTMRLLVDGDASRPLSTSSLGTLNVLYFALLELGLADQIERREVAHLVLAIEEPEAHLHPHLQRLVFGRLLDSQRRGESVVVTTQSPHIASVADPQNLIVLRQKNNETVAFSARDASLSDREWQDLGRYLDATRAELVFARRALLVEGYAEQVLIPRLAQARGIDLDKEGITVCSINGAHFASYAVFCEALGIPWCVITDGDQQEDGSRAGEKRANSLLSKLNATGAPEDAGIFVGDSTFEYDLFQASTVARSAFVSALLELASEASHVKIDEWREHDPGVDLLVKTIRGAGGKGRFAQRLSASTAELEGPAYVNRALDYLVAQ